jgi:apolipoprotein D and lipocalin family protein
MLIIIDRVKRKIMGVRQALIASLAFTLGCAGPRYPQTSLNVELPRYMGTWYVWAGRTTSFEKGASNSVEKYSWNPAKDRIDVDFSYRKGGVNGKLKRLPQKAWVVKGSGNAHWKVQPLWPLRFDYQIVAFDPDYAWTIVGVPDGAYLWIMGREPIVSDAKLAELIDLVGKTGYPVHDVSRVNQDWSGASAPRSGETPNR